jgi:3-methyladenine DNA glycosylase AlkD
MAIINALEARKDPAYEASMRRLIPSSQKAHPTPLPEVRKVVAEWHKSHRDVLVDDLFSLCEALWSTAWREERIVAIHLIGGSEQAMDSVEWEMLRNWSADVDNWEHIDHLGDVTGRMLQMQPRLIGRIEQLAGAYNHWQRRLAMVTLIVAGRDFAWEAALLRMAERLKNDDEPAVRKAVTWARREIKQREAKYG